MLVVILICLIWFFHSNNNKEGYANNRELITCIMITGKNDLRKRFALASVRNFREQDYANKHLVILNHGNYNLVETPVSLFNVTEIHIRKDDTITLGDLRNMAFEFIPYNGLFCVWDDDDYRSPRFLSTMYSELLKNKTDCVCLTNRLEYNAVTNYSWHVHLKKGFVHVLARKHYAIKYMSKDTMEDTKLLDDMRDAYQVMEYDNDPTLYVRLVHGQNSSLYVDSEKAGIRKGASGPEYIERELKENEAAFIGKVYKSYLDTLQISI